MRKFHPCGGQMLQQFQIAEIPIQDQRRLPEQLLTLGKPPQVILLARSRLVSEGARRKGNELDGKTLWWLQGNQDRRIGITNCRWIDGEENEDRITRAKDAVLAANPNFEETTEVYLPEVPRIPFQRNLIDDMDQLAALVKQFLPEVEPDPRLHALSFVDPIRLGCEELGIVVTPRVARQPRQSLQAVFTFEPEQYDQVSVIRPEGML